MGIFDNLNGSMPRDSRNRKLEDGDYTVVVKKCIGKVSEQFGNPVYIVELEVETSNHPAFKPGDSASWTQNMSAKGASGALSNFVCSALELTMPRDKDKIEKEVSPKLQAIAIASVDQGFLNGHRVHVNVKTKKTRAGYDFRAHYWSSVK